MSSTFTVNPSSTVGSARRDRTNEPGNLPSSEFQVHHPSQHQHLPSTPVALSATSQNHTYYSYDQSHLTPYSPTQALSNSASPILNSHTPAESISTLSVNYQSSEFSEFGDDPFFGVSFNQVEGGSPSFLDDPFLQSALGDSYPDPAISPSQAALENLNYALEAGAASYNPITPDHTPSLHTTSSYSGDSSGGASRATFPDPVPKSVSPDELGRLRRQLPNSAGLISRNGSQLTPDTSGSGSGRSSEDGLVPTLSGMTGQSPWVTVSLWGRDNVDETYAPEAGGIVAGISTDDIGVQYSVPGQSSFTSGEEAAQTVGTQRGLHGGFDPDNRPTTEIPSLNQQTQQREVEAKNQEVDEWLSRAPTNPMGTPQRQSSRSLAEPLRLQTGDEGEGVSDREIELGHETKNNPVAGQTYYLETGGLLTQEDIQIMRQNRNWADAPVLFPITQPDDARYQPETSQAAIERFNRMCQDNDSVVSRAATWGTRRRSLPSISDIEGVTSGNFLKKLSLSRGDMRRPSILRELRGLVRKPSASPKRPRPEHDEEGSGSGEQPQSSEPRARQDSLAPPNRSSSWGKKSPVPSINTAFVAMGNNMASIGTTHARSSSISSNTPIISPKSPSNLLSVKGGLNRIRSKSDLTKGSSSSSIADMWKKTGGPPVASLAKTSVAPNITSAVAGPDADDDDEEDDDVYEDPETKADADKLIEDITPNFAGFREHVLKLNPLLATSSNYLVDRIAHQQIVRYKGLLNNKLKHLGQVASRSCASGSMCIALGGSANMIDSRGDPRSMDPLSARFDPSDGDMTPMEGAITQESFPTDIPMPPTSSLPAEFECQLCYQPKKFQKPSDWTKHVHEDVQPFTCTWDRCRDPKIFKRKADWVRHENEGHRHLEWWTCDVDDCRHICYRRDNFLQHLVREHKFAEPKVKTKAAIKRAGAVDATWQKVENCHEETRARPQDELCRFCGRSFPTWKKLTVHLAKHMEQISLPILRLVARKELDADTIISPVQDPPPRSYPASFSSIDPQIKPEPQSFEPSPIAQTTLGRGPGHMGYSTTPQHQQQQQFMFPMGVSGGRLQQPIYHTQFEGFSPAMSSSSFAVQPPQPPASHGFTSLNPQGYNTMPVTSGNFMGAGNPSQYISVGTQDVEPFPNLTMNALGLQDPTGMVGQMGPLGGMMDPGSTSGTEQQQQQQQQQQHFAAGGHHSHSSSFSHSPHQGQGPFFHHPSQ